MINLDHYEIYKDSVCIYFKPASIILKHFIIEATDYEYLWFNYPELYIGDDYRK